MRRPDRRGSGSGAFSFLSWRDPNLIATLDVFDGSADFLRGLEPGEAELTRNIIGTIGEVDRYLLPDAKGFASMQRWLTGDTEDIRQEMREEMLRTGVADHRNFADVLGEVASAGNVVVLGSEPAINAANAERHGFLMKSTVL